MRRVKHTLRGSTLAETLVMMLVAGIVFLAAMEAQLGLPRMAFQRMEEVLEYLFKYAEDRPLVLVLDEYPHLQKLLCLTVRPEF